MINFISVVRLCRQSSC